MAMRLYRAVRRRGLAVLPEYADLVLDNGAMLRDQVLDGIARAVLVDVQNVADFERSGHAPLLREMTGLVSPWPDAWIEFTSPDGCDLAALVLSDHITKDRANTLRASLSQGGYRTPEGVPVEFLLPEGGFVETTHLILTLPGQGDMPLLAGWAYAFCDEEGNPGLAGDGRYRLLAKAPHVAIDILRYVSRVTSLAFGLANCRNVALVEGEDASPSRQARRYAERTGEPPPPRFYTLRIGPLSSARSAGPSSGSHRDLPLHIVRGHFSRYTEERPLFGKYSGLFWVPAHVRGSADVGVIGKDYQVEVAG